jgi:hypothetical protein
MVNGDYIELRSVEDLIQALQRVDASAIQSGHRDAIAGELQRIKKNVSAILIFTSYSASQAMGEDSELRHAVEEVRRQCLLVNGMISRMQVRLWSPIGSNKVEYALDVLTHYHEMTRAACRMCMLFAPEQGNNLAQAF